MARILFGGPQEKERGSPSPVHDDLVARLRKEGHEVDYFTRGDDMFGHLMSTRNPDFMNPNYGIVIYDTQLFYDQAEPKERAELFVENAIDFLKFPQLPVIVLADNYIAKPIRETCQQAGFKQINQPYNIDEVVGAVNSFLR